MRAGGLDPDQFARALGLVSTVLGAGKDALAREYVSLATSARGTLPRPARVVRRHRRWFCCSAVTAIRAERLTKRYGDTRRHRVSLT